MYVLYLYITHSFVEDFEYCRGQDCLNHVVFHLAAPTSTNTLGGRGAGLSLFPYKVLNPGSQI